MASVVIYTDNPAHAAATRTRDSLVGKGHTATIVANSLLDSHDASSYACMLCVRTTGGLDAGDLAALRTKVNAGKPLLLGLIDTSASAGTGKTTLASRLNYIGTSEISSNVDVNLAQDITDNTHAITSSWGIQNVNIYPGNNFSAAVDVGQSFVGTGLAEPDANNAAFVAGQKSIIAIPSGTNDLLGSPIGARVVVASSIYAGQTAYTADGNTLLHNMVVWATGGGGIPSLGGSWGKLELA